MILGPNSKVRFSFQQGIEFSQMSDEEMGTIWGEYFFGGGGGGCQFSSKCTNRKIGIEEREALTVEGGGLSRLVALALLGGLELIMRCNSSCLIGLDLGGPGRNTAGLLEKVTLF